MNRFAYLSSPSGSHERKHRPDVGCRVGERIRSCESVKSQNELLFRATHSRNAKLTGTQSNSSLLQLSCFHMIESSRHCRNDLERRPSCYRSRISFKQNVRKLRNRFLPASNNSSFTYRFTLRSVSLNYIDEGERTLSPI